MTTPVQQTTVFSLPVVVAPVRCEEGRRLFKAWIAKYNAVSKQPGDQWQIVLMRDFGPYLKHAKDCDRCKDYEYTLRGRVLEVAQEEK